CPRGARAVPARYLGRAPAAAALSTLPLHDALPICVVAVAGGECAKFVKGLGLSRRIGQVQRGALSRAGEDRLGNGGGHEFRGGRSEEHTSELQSRFELVCRLLLEKTNAPATVRAED